MSASSQWKILQALSLHCLNPIKPDIGSWGERAAIKYLKGRGYKILAKNWSCRKGEIDIIAQDGDALCFIEVKTRTTKHISHIDPLAGIDLEKQRRLKMLAEIYLQKHSNSSGRWREFRFDVVVVLYVKPLPLLTRIEKIEIIKDAFS